MKIPPNAVKTCAGLDCPERRSVCCGAKCITTTRDSNGMEYFACKNCLEDFVGGKCTAGDSIVNKCTPDCQPDCQYKSSQRQVKKGIILDLCGGTGSWSRPYRDAGYDVRVITLPEYDIINQDVRNMCVYLNPVGILAAPPCTMFSRARTTAKTPRDFQGAMKVVRACLEVIWRCQYSNAYNLRFWAMENPAGHLQRFMGKPPFKFHPYDFGDRHSKETFIWGFFNHPKKRPIKLNEIELKQSRNNTRPLPPIPENYRRDGKMKPVQIRRSITPQGFAKAFYEANK